MRAVAAVLGATAGFGVLITTAGILTPVPDRRRERRSWPADRVLLRTVLALGLSGAAVILTRWPVAVLAAAITGAVIPSLRSSTNRRHLAVQRSEAVAAWAELVRDTMAGAAGLNEAILTTARVAPTPIRDQVKTLAIRAEHQPLNVALCRFAEDLQDPVADSVVAALVLSLQRQAGTLAPVLSQIAANAREQAAMRQRIEASRARTYTSARFIVLVTLAFSAGLVVLAPDYLIPFSSVEGQAVLCFVVGLFAAAGWSLHRLANATPAPRLLTNPKANP